MNARNAAAGDTTQKSNTTAGAGGRVGGSGGSIEMQSKNHS